jgi:hypothetical protein
MFVAIKDKMQVLVFEGVIIGKYYRCNCWQNFKNSFHLMVSKKDQASLNIGYFLGSIRLIIL